MSLKRFIRVGDVWTIDIETVKVSRNLTGCAKKNLIKVLCPFTIQDYTELDMRLSDIPVNMHTSSELLRLSLRKSDEEMETSDDDRSSKCSSEIKENNDMDVVSL